MIGLLVSARTGRCHSDRTRAVAAHSDFSPTRSSAGPTSWLARDSAPIKGGLAPASIALVAKGPGAAVCPGQARTRSVKVAAWLT